MPTARVPTKRRPTPPTARSAKPAPNAARRKKRTAARKQQGSRKPSAAAGDFPSWRDLATGNERDAQRPAVLAQIDNVSTIRFGLVLLALAAVFTLYIGHVHATQDLLDDLQQVRRENLQLHLEDNRLKGTFDRLTGPSVVYQRAGAMGLKEGIAYGPTIREE
jgi:hypothetical protein